MAETRKTRWQRFVFNLFPAYRRTGGRVTYISGDYKELHIAVKLNWKTRNYVGTIFGGSMFGAADPIYMIMLIRLLGPAYVVWDKAADIHFVRPGTGKIKACFKVTDQEVEEVKAAIAKNGEGDFQFTVAYTNREGKVVAKITKNLYVADKAFYKEKKKRKQQLAS